MTRRLWRIQKRRPRVGAFRAAADGGAAAVLIIGSGIFARNADLLNELELGSRLPTLYPENSGQIGEGVSLDDARPINSASS